jgi:two-component system CheB/CheR fusion protein
MTPQVARYVPKQADPDIDIGPLLQLIKAEHGLDFSGYRRASLARRVQKRMRSMGIIDVEAYRDLLTICRLERERLIDAILINVTSFFRDESSWECLAEKAVPQLLGRKAGAGKIRIWSAGCATGEEPYTLAMIFAKAMGMDEFTRRVTIHATDVDEDALNGGRRARYSEDRVRHLPPALLRDYFRRVDDNYSVRAQLRQRVTFHRHDIISDPPVMHVDLLACRNTLMYLNSDTQLRILKRFHRALNDGGILFLGRAETLLPDDTAFRPIDLKRRISAKVAGA